MRCAPRSCRVGAISHSLAHVLEIIHRYQPPLVLQWVARLIPLRIVLSTDDMQEVALGEGQLLGRLAVVVVQRFDDLCPPLVSHCARSCRTGMCAR